MKSTTVTLTALQDIMTFCPRHAAAAATLALLYEEDPLKSQLQTKDLVREVITAGDIGTMPPERLQDLAIWASIKPTAITDQNRYVVQMRLTPAEKAMVQELADAYTDGNMTKILLLALRKYAGIEI